MENKSNSQTSTAEELMNFVRMILSEEWIAKISPVHQNHIDIDMLNDEKNSEFKLKKYKKEPPKFRGLLTYLLWRISAPRSLKKYDCIFFRLRGYL